jgi:FtsP/CotA-like multicopper oxidase with cupredoxin domain
MSRRSNERLTVVEQKVSHMEEKVDKISIQVSEMHSILLQAKGVRWTIVVVSGLVGFVTGISHWLLSKS